MVESPAIQRAVGIPAASITCFANVLDELDARRRGSGAEHGHAARSARVSNAGRSRGIRPDHHEIDLAFGGEPGDAGRVGDVDVDVLRDLGGSAVAGGDDDVHVAAVAPACPRQRVLASPTSDDEYPPYSHSIVDGGLLDMSYTTRLTPGTSLTMRRLIRPSTS